MQAVAAFLNIQLPFQKPYPIYSSVSGATASTQHSAYAMHPTPTFASMSSGGPGPASLNAAGKMPMSSSHAGSQHHGQPSPYVTLTPYVRRLVATGFDVPSILHGFFGDDWAAGIGPLHEAERRNYLFAAKSDTWLRVKASYDMDGEQTIPFLKPLQSVIEKEIEGAEASWSEWLAMQDWMLGPRAPADVHAGAPQGHAGDSAHGVHRGQGRHSEHTRHPVPPSPGSGVRVKMEEDQ